MSCAVKLLLVAALALMLVPHSFANELLPPDIIRMLETPAFQPDVLTTKDSPGNRTADNPTDIKKSGEQLPSPVVQYQTLNEYLPPDIIRMLEAPALQPDSSGSKDSSTMASLHDPNDVKTSGRQVTKPVVQRSSLKDWWPLDIIRTWVIPFDP